MSETAVRVHIRWMIRRDMPQVCDFAQEIGGWTEDEFLHCLRQRNCMGMVAEVKDRPVAYMIYSIDSQEYLTLLTFGVDPIYQRQGIGALMLDKLVSKLRPYRRTHLRFTVPTDELDFLVFLTRYGFKAEAYDGGTDECVLSFFPKRYEGV